MLTNGIVLAITEHDSLRPLGYKLTTNVKEKFVVGTVYLGDTNAQVKRGRPF